MKKIIIIGAGASGVYLSILLKQKLNDQGDVIVLEQNSSPLKKLLATGNGRCNLSNTNMSIEYYQSDHQDYVDSIISSFDMEKAMDHLGILCIKQDTLIYPRTLQASTIKNVFIEQAEKLGVVFLYNQEVLSIDVSQNYIIKTNQQTFHSDYVVFAMGSEAGKLSGTSLSRYDLLTQLKLPVIKPTPSLVQMCTKPVLKELKGVRVKGTFSLLENQKVIHVEKGELLFTDYGISGIAVMQLSSFVESGHDYQIMIDFFDDMDEKKLYEYIEKRMLKDYNHFYDGMLNTKLASYFEKQKLKDVSQIVHHLKHMTLQITHLKSYETAQVMKGGLSLSAVKDTLELKKYPCMYAIGEILNVSGMCGGYNLHFALSSAYRVACDIEGKYYAKNQ